MQSLKICVTLGLAWGAIGCGSSAPKLPALQPVSGVVTLDGKPLVQAAVTFMPVKMTKGLGATASTDENGEFTAMYPVNNKPGCPEGEYKVMFQKMETRTGGPIPAGMTAAAAEARNVIPMKYSRMDDVVNLVMIPPGGKMDLKFDLKK